MTFKKGYIPWNKGLNYESKKGRIPWNKGIKTGIIPSTAFKKGQKPWNKKEKIEIICKYCNQTFLVIPAKKNRTKFCSIKCHINYITGKSYEELYGKESAKKHKNALQKFMKERGNPFTWPEVRKKISISQRGLNNSWFKCLNKTYTKGGFRKDLGHYVRSSWEANYARILKYEGKEYKYEPTTFDLEKGLTYTPDFYITKIGEFFEIKGWFRERDKKKINLFRQKYPYINLHVIEKQKYKELKKKYMPLISNWEDYD